MKKVNAYKHEFIKPCLNLMKIYSPNKINNHFFIWKIKSTRDFIIFVSLITMVGIIIGSAFSMQSIYAQETPVLPQGNDVPQSTGYL